MSETFVVEGRCEGTQGRAGRLRTPHGEVETPVFAPVGTQAAVKTLSAGEVKDLGAQIILANAYLVSFPW